MALTLSIKHKIYLHVSFTLGHQVYLYSSNSSRGDLKLWSALAMF